MLQLLLLLLTLFNTNFSIFRSFYYPGLFLRFVVLLISILFCTFSRINLFSFYLFFESNLVFELTNYP
jgi:hypothetical protein